MPIKKIVVPNASYQLFSISNIHIYIKEATALQLIIGKDVEHGGKLENFLGSTPSEGVVSDALSESVTDKTLKVALRILS